MPYICDFKLVDDSFCSREAEKNKKFCHDHLSVLCENCDKEPATHECPMDVDSSQGYTFGCEAALCNSCIAAHTKQVHNPKLEKTRIQLRCLNQAVRTISKCTGLSKSQREKIKTASGLVKEVVAEISATLPE